jgi:hypothetical protein
MTAGVRLVQRARSRIGGAMPVPLAERETAPAARETSLAELERLWESSPAPSRAAASRERQTAGWRARAYERLVTALVYGWPGVLGVVFLLAPASSTPVAAWVDLASVLILLGPIGALCLFAAAPRFGLAASALLGGLGIAVGIACRATEHHLGAWWMLETAAFAALTAVSIACFAVRPRN